MSAPALALLAPPSDPARELKQQARDTLRRLCPHLTLAAVVLTATNGERLTLPVQQDDADRCRRA